MKTNIVIQHIYCHLFKRKDFEVFLNSVNLFIADSQYQLANGFVVSEVYYSEIKSLIIYRYRSEFNLSNYSKQANIMGYELLLWDNIHTKSLIKKFSKELDNFLFVIFLKLIKKRNSFKRVFLSVDDYFQTLFVSIIESDKKIEVNYIDEGIGDYITHVTVTRWNSFFDFPHIKILFRNLLYGKNIYFFKLHSRYGQSINFTKFYFLFPSEAAEFFINKNILSISHEKLILFYKDAFKLKPYLYSMELGSAIKVFFFLNLEKTYLGIDILDLIERIALFCFDNKYIFYLKPHPLSTMSYDLLKYKVIMLDSSISAEYFLIKNPKNTLVISGISTVLFIASILGIPTISLSGLTNKSEKDNPNIFHTLNVKYVSNLNDLFFEINNSF